MSIPKPRKTANGSPQRWNKNPQTSSSLNSPSALCQIFEAWSSLTIPCRFLKAEHAKYNQQAEGEGEEPAVFITFEQLLDPAQNGKIVAAQAFHHTLLLATKGLVYVSQEESYGSIQISIF